MKKIFTLLVLAFSILSFKAVAQTNTACNADFSFTVNGNTVQFTPVANPDSSIVQHTWIFGDGSAAQDVYAPSHTYSDTGTYVVTQYVIKTSTAGAVACSDTVRETVRITNVPCNIQPTFTWKIDTLTRTVYFVNTTFLPSTLALPSIWFFGDDSSANTWNATHVYAKPGTYYVCLRLQPGPNCVKYQCDSITIPSPVVCNIQAYFIDQADSSKPNEIQFTDYTTNLLSTDSTYWTFGDSTSSRDKNPSHIYTKPGTYNACLTITRIITPGAVPCTSTFCRTIVIQPVCNLTANFTYRKDSLSSSPYTYSFTNTSTLANNFDSSYWNFGDGTTSYDINPIHAFTAPGTYTVCLYIKNTINSATTAACTSNICETVVVPALCNIKVAYTWKVDSLKQNTIDFTNTTPLPVTGTSVIWSFGDGSPLDSTWDATHTYTQPGKYYVCLRVQTNNTCINYQCDSITVPAPVCDFQPSYTWQLDSRTQNTVDFTNTTITPNTGATARWFFGDGTADSTWSTMHTFTQPGKYYVCLRVQLNPTCYKYQCDSITVPTPVCNVKANYTWKVDSLKQNTIDFTNTTITTVTNSSVKWSFGDGSPLDSTWNASHTYTQPGKYYVCLRIQTSSNCVSYQCDSITVPAPVCDFQPSYTWQLDSRYQNTIDFTNTTITTVAGATARWFFGDGTADSTWSTMHTFTQPGKYYVCLRVQLNPTCYKYQCDSITIPNPIVCNIQAYFNSTTDSVNINSIHFHNYSTNLTTTDSSYWTFGDGTISRDINPTHVYAQAGTYDVCLTIKRITVHGAVPCTSTFCRTIVIQPVCNIQPNYTWKEDSANYTTISFTNTTIPVSTAAKITWYFGDGSYATSWNASHTYAQPGKYYVCLRIETDSSCIKYKCDSITVAAPMPDCNSLSLFTFAKSETNPVYIFTPDYENSSLQYTWTFGDGTGSHDIISNHTYLLPGNYTACLTTYRSDSCASTSCKPINVVPPINCDNINITFQYRRDSILPNRIYFFETSNVLAAQQTWVITNVSGQDSSVIINQQNPYYIFTDTGYYNVCLRAVTANGCLKQYCSVIHIEAIPAQCILPVYPNPAQSTISINVQLPASEVIHASVYTVQNVLLKEQDQQGIAGNNLITISIANLPAGFYTIRFVYDNNICVAKFEKM